MNIEEVLDGPIMKDYLIIDELNRSDPRAFPKGFFNITGDKTYNGKSLPFKYILFTLNEGEMYQTNELDPAIISRIGFFLRTQAFQPKNLRKHMHNASVTPESVASLHLSTDERKILDWISENYERVQLPELIYDILDDVDRRLKAELKSNSDYLGSRNIIFIKNTALSLRLIEFIIVHNYKYEDLVSMSNEDFPELSLRALKSAFILALKDRFAYLKLVPDFDKIINEIFEIYEATGEFMSLMKATSAEIKSISVSSFVKNSGDNLHKFGKYIFHQPQLIIDNFHRYRKEYNSQIIIDSFVRNIINPLSSFTRLLPEFVAKTHEFVTDSIVDIDLKRRLIFLRFMIKIVDYVAECTLMEIDQKKNHKDLSFSQKLEEINEHRAAIEKIRNRSEKEKEDLDPFMMERTFLFENEPLNQFLGSFENMMKKLFILSFEDLFAKVNFLKTLTRKQQIRLHSRPPYNLKLDFYNFAGASDFANYKKILHNYQEYGLTNKKR